jgi:hypothetical protein
MIKPIAVFTVVAYALMIGTSSAVLVTSEITVVDGRRGDFIRCRYFTGFDAIGRQYKYSGPVPRACALESWLWAGWLCSIRSVKQLSDMKLPCFVACPIVSKFAQTAGAPEPAPFCA